jgi:hypothetical protein
VAGGLLRPIGSPSEAISDRDECLFFPGAEATKPRKPSVSLPLISCFGKCRSEKVKEMKMVLGKWKKPFPTLHQGAGKLSSCGGEKLSAGEGEGAWY